METGRICFQNVTFGEKYSTKRQTDNKGDLTEENKRKQYSVVRFNRFLSLLSYLIPFRFAHGRHERIRFVKVDFFALVALVVVYK